MTSYARNLILGTAAALLLSCVALFSAEPPVYSLEDCIGIGQEHNAAARKARMDREIGEALVSQARSEALPQLSLNGSYTRVDELQEIDLADPTAAGGSGGAGSTIELGSLDNYQAGAEISQLLFSGGRVRAALRAARSSRGYYERTAAATEGALVRDIRLGFHAVLFARETVRVREEAVSNLTVHVEQAERKYRSGTISEFDLISARVRLANEEPTLIAARNAYALALADLRRVLGLEEQAFAVEGALLFAPQRFELDALQRLALDSRADIGQMEMLVRLRESDESAAVSGTRPTLRSFFNYTEYNPYGFAAQGGQWEGHWTAGLTLDWTLWDGGLTRGTVKQKRLETAKARIDLVDMRSIVRLQVEEAYLALTHAAQAVAASSGNVELAGRALAIARNRYESGLGTHLEFADSALSLSAAQLTRIQSLREYQDALARLQYACGAEDRDLYREVNENR